MNERVEINAERNAARARIVSCFTAGDFPEAEQAARRLFQADAGDEEALHLLAQTVNRLGRGGEALALMRDLLDLNPMRAGYHNDYGAMLAALERWPEAEAAYRMSLALEPAGIVARFNLALALSRQGRLDEALARLDELSEKAPDFADQYLLRGELLRSAGRHEEAAAVLSKALELGLESPAILMCLGLALSEAGRCDEAYPILARAGVVDPDSASVNFYLGNVAQGKRQFNEAADYFHKAIAANPDFAEAHNNLGLVLREFDDDDGAEAEFARALSIDPHLVAAHTNMGSCHLRKWWEKGRMEAALACYRKVAELDPECVENLRNLGDTCQRMQRLDAAEGAYRKALALQPDCVVADLNLGTLLLLRGDFAEGLRRHEKRWEKPENAAKRPSFAQPEWAGEPLADKTLLIYAEQGLGDNVQFIRYLRVLRERYPTARLYYACWPPLLRLFADYAASCAVSLLSVQGADIPPIDYHIALLSIPWIVGTTLATVPADVPYLEPSAGLIEKWEPRLPGLPGKKVGVVWSGQDIFIYDTFRSLRLAQLAPLLEIPEIQWISLQKGAVAGQIAEQGYSGRIFNPMEEVEDFADTAAIAANLDLIISVDTSVAHLAGALGKPVWLLNRFDTDWRWLLDRDDSPWYPTMRVFRQTSFGDWDSVVAQVVEALSAWVIKDAPVAT
ncbi:MAG: tetratricopeptide repeat protein [Candidatus Accumulibacter sp.]|nr:tetratricopeptide repeat protein [Accumulibacter sp.]